MKMRMNVTLWVMVFLIVSSLGIHTEVIAASDATLPTATPAWIAADPWLIYAVIGIIFIGSLISVVLIRSALSDSKWSLGDALSEEAKVTSLEADGNGGFKPRLDAAGNPVMITELRASSSRMIAFVGMLLILLMFLGFGIFSIFSFAKTGVMPNTENIVNFLVAGLTLFAPYLVNQFASLFEKFAPKKT